MGTYSIASLELFVCVCVCGLAIVLMMALLEPGFPWGGVAVLYQQHDLNTQAMYCTVFGLLACSTKGSRDIKPPIEIRSGANNASNVAGCLSAARIQAL
jgi:hypothetical protein